MPTPPSRLLMGLLLAPLLPCQDDTTWTDATTLTVEGRGWTDTAAPWDRLPAAARETVRERVWQLSRQSAGLAVRFVSDSPTVHVRWKLRSNRLARPHMAATGVSGVDLYARDGSGRWRWIQAGKPRGTVNTTTLLRAAPAERREYLLYLPLYNGVETLEVGIATGHEIAPGPERPPDHRRPIVFYGTSITHGACASRPGMGHTAQLGRRFDRPVVNLGFSGNGRLEPALAELLGGLDAAVFVVDCLPNLHAEQVAERTVPFVRRLRELRPDVPIVLVEDRTYQNAWLEADLRERNEASRAAFRAGYERLRADGVGGLHYLEGDGLLGDDGDGTVDGSHPTDLGFARQADAFAEVLGPLLQ